MDYKDLREGDEVRILPLEKINELRNVNDGCYSAGDEQTVASMNRVVKIATINKRCDAFDMFTYSGKIYENNTPLWVIEGFMFESGEAIEVSDGYDWHTRRFVAYTPSGRTIALTDDDNVAAWKHSRPIREPEPVPLPLWELTLAEIADKFGIKLEQLRIKK